MNVIDCKKMIVNLLEKIDCLRDESLSAGTKYRLMGLVADIMEVTELLSREVLERVKQEPVLDVDVDVDFDALAEEVLSWELVKAGGGLEELTQQVNDALGGLNDVLTQIGSQLERRHKDEAYARLYDQEKRRYLNSGTPPQPESRPCILPMCFPTNCRCARSGNRFKNCGTSTTWHRRSGKCRKRASRLCVRKIWIRFSRIS